jgi:hypothetical protein
MMKTPSLRCLAFSWLESVAAVRAITRRTSSGALPVMFQFPASAAGTAVALVPLEWRSCRILLKKFLENKF